MISGLITLMIIFGIVLIFAVILKLVRLAITLAIIVGIAALIMHFFKKKSS